MIIFIISHRRVYSTVYDTRFWQNEFPKTQLVIGDKADRFYSDTELYAILGYKYALGQNPVTMHPEVPPLGKQIIGAGIILFRNQNLASLLLGLGGLSLLYLIGLKVSPSRTVVLLTVLLVSLDRVFHTLISDSYIDTPQLFLFLLSLYLFLSSLTNQRRFILASLSLGLMMATKFYFNGLLLLAVYLIYLTLQRNFRIFMGFTLSLPAVAIGYLLPYTYSFITGFGLTDWIRLQRWMTSWWAGNARVPWGGIFSIIFTGNWHTWWGNRDIIAVGEWTPLWPLAAVLGFISIFQIIKNRNYPGLLLWLWCIFYLLFLSVTSPFPRYLILLMPFLYLLTLDFIRQLFSRLNKTKT